MLLNVIVVIIASNDNELSINLPSSHIHGFVGLSV